MPAARPTRRATSAVMGYWLAWPRMPSVPKYARLLMEVPSMGGAQTTRRPGHAEPSASGCCVVIPVYARRGFRQIGRDSRLQKRNSRPMCGIIGIVGVEPVCGPADRQSQAPGIPRLRQRRRRRPGGRSRGAPPGQGQDPRARSCASPPSRSTPPSASATPAGPPTARPPSRNAHPHTAGRVTVVHNGIIENFAALKAELIARGRVFESDTDTEVVAHLIDASLESRPRSRSRPSRRPSTG